MWEHLTRPVHRCQHRHNQRIQKRDALSVEKADNWLHQCGFSMEMMEELHGITVEHAAMRSSMENPNGLMCVFFNFLLFPSDLSTVLDLAWSVSGNCVVWKDLCFGSWFWNFDPEQLPRPQNLRPLLLQITSLHMSVRSPIPISWQLW